MTTTYFPTDKKGNLFGPYNYYDQGEGFSATDITAIIPPNTFPGVKYSIPLGTMAMVSVSTHRDKFPVASFGRIAPKAFTAGHRVIAGTMAFNTIDRAAFARIAKESLDAIIASNIEGVTTRPDYVYADELPPFNIIITAVNEYGQASYATIEGITLLDEGANYSLENVLLMESYSFMAIRKISFQPVGLERKSSDSFINNGAGNTPEIVSPVAKDSHTIHASPGAKAKATPKVNTVDDATAKFKLDKVGSKQYNPVDSLTTKQAEGFMFGDLNKASKSDNEAELADSMGWGIRPGGNY
jgi:hypothetical protein